MKKRIISILICASMTAALAAGCGNRSSSDSDAGSDNSAAADSGSVSYTIVTSSTYAPFCYLNEDNELTGYDVAVMKEGHR